MRQYIIYDLEATCWENEKNSNRINEVIEIGAVKLDEGLNQTGTFQTFVKPTKNPALSDFCTGLTGIKQRDVDAAPYFTEAVYNFECWVYGGGADSILVSWGLYDKIQLLSESYIKHYYGKIVHILKNRHRNLKKYFAKIRGVKRCGLEEALKILGIPFGGTHHRAIDDAINTSEIFKTVFDEWNRLGI